MCAAASADGVAIKRAERPEDDPDAMRCDAMRRDADFGKCNCNLLKFVAVAANRDTNRRRRRLNKTRKTNAAPKKKYRKTNRSHAGKKFRSRFLSRFCVVPSAASTLRPAHFAGHQKLQWRSEVDAAIVFQGYLTHTVRTTRVAALLFFSLLLFFCIVCVLLFLLRMIMTEMEQISISYRWLRDFFGSV